jgi:hypothetical protein
MTNSHHHDATLLYCRSSALPDLSSLGGTAVDFVDVEPDDGEGDHLWLARSHFSSHEYRRCAASLDAVYADAADATAVALRRFPPRALFLRCYALYMVRSRF